MRLSLAVVCWFALAYAVRAAELPVPVVQFTFSNSVENEGSQTGETEIVGHAAGEEPAFGPGVRGMGMSFAASSRGGGTERTKAGGSVVLRGVAVGRLEQLTLSVWFKPIERNAPARLLYCAPSWDLFVANERMGFKVKHNGKDHIKVTDSHVTAAVEGTWNFVAVTYDRDAGQCRLYHATQGQVPTMKGSWDDVPQSDLSDGVLEIGNLDGIRPFKGSIDSVRIYDSVLSAEQVATLLRLDERTDSLCDYARRMPARSAVLEHGDVCLSSRGIRANAAETFQAFQARRLLWSYAASPSFIQGLRAAGAVTFQGAINSIPGTDNVDAHALDLDGKPVIAPWMVAFNRKKPWYWGCNNRPLFMELSVQRAKRLLDAGADWIQFDDWSMIVSAHSWGGACFCDDCMKGFSEYLKSRLSADEAAALGIGSAEAFDYRGYLSERHGIADAKSYKSKRRSLPTTKLFEDFQRRSVRSFFEHLRARIDAVAGRRVPMSCNSTLHRPSQRSNYTVDVMDFLQGETWHMALVDLAIPCKTAEALGRWQVFVPKPRDLRVARMAIAASYAMGQIMLVPWDMYMGSDATGIRPRYYGTVEDYGDLFHFIAGNPKLFNGCENPAMVAVVADYDHYDGPRLARVCQRLLDAQAPFTIVPVGHSYYENPLSAERLKGFHTLVLASDLDQLSPSDQAAVRDASRDVAVFRDREATGEVLEDLSPFSVWGPKGVHIIARVTGDGRLLCHVLNRAEAREGHLKWVSFLVRKQAFLGDRLVSVRWHSPGQEATALDWDDLADGARVIVPRLPIWGVAELAFESAKAEGD